MGDQAGVTHVYAGVAKLPGDTVGGIFRWGSDTRRWEQLANGLPDQLDVHAITVHPDNSDIVFIGTKKGLFRTKDHGDHWERLGFADPAMQVWSILVDPSDHNTIIAGGSPVAIFRSRDGGDTWQEMATPPMPGRIQMSFACRVMRLAIDPTNSRNVYAAVEVDGAMRSHDGGETWEDCSADLIRLSTLPHLANKLGSPHDSEGMLDAHAISISPANPKAIFLAVRMGIFRSDDDGTTWKDLEIRRFSPVLFYGRDLRVSPVEPKVMYAGLSLASRSNSGSIWRSGDLGESWQRFDHGLDVRSTIMGVAPHPRDPKQVYMAGRLGQVFGTTDGGKTWMEFPLPATCQDVFALACG